MQTAAPGHLGNLNSSQTQALAAFKNSLPDVPDNVALRFLRQSLFDIAAVIAEQSDNAVGSNPIFLEHDQVSRFLDC